MLPATTAGGGFDAAAAWRRNPAVAVRPEPFGALLYDFTTRRLSFLTSPALVDLVEVLGEHASAAAAVDDVVAAGRLDPSERGRYLAALARLADDGTIERREP